MRKHMKNRKGVTLLELILAIGILAIVSVPIFGLLAQSTRLNAEAHRFTIATFVAQQNMEELVGRDEAYLINRQAAPPNLITYNGFHIGISVDPVPHLPQPNALRMVTVSIFSDSSGNRDGLIVEQINYLNVMPGGF